MENFEVGDVVRLKSGGPMMTVTGMRYDIEYICQWFVDTKAFSGFYPASALYSKHQVEEEEQQRTKLFAKLG
jgi:uncharacterized protein YodC (DUF2158 family)